jgi:hypothetical protein
MTVNELVHMGMASGAPFPDLYDWTWGELVEYIECSKERERDALRKQASMEFTQANLIARMVMGKQGSKFKLMEEYSFLWTDAERREAKKNELIANLTARTAKSQEKTTVTRESQTEMLRKLEAERQRLAEEAKRSG